jgi:chaperonin GroEL
VSTIEVFYSYAHKDEILREELEKQLSLLQWQGIITGWHDRRIGAGQEWADEIDTHLNTARIILLLISPDFMASKYCYGIEVKRAMERHEQGEALVIPVILRPVYWKSAPFGKLQALPTDAIPVTSSKWHDLDEAFFNVAEGIRKTVEALTGKASTALPIRDVNTSIPDQATSAGYVLKAEETAKIQELARSGSGDVPTTIILVQTIIAESLKYLTTGADSMRLKHGLDKAAQAVIDYIRREARPLESREEIVQIASVSAGDETIGNLIADVMDRTGKDGVVHVRESFCSNFEVEYSEGFQFDQGYISPYFVTNAEKQEAVIENPLLLLVDGKIKAVQALLPLLEKMKQQGKRDIVIIAEDVEDMVLEKLVENKRLNTFNVLAVKAPDSGDLRSAILEDIASLTGGTVINEKFGLRLENTTLRDLGTARKVIATKDTTTVIEGAGDAGNIIARIREIKAQIEETRSDDDREKLKERIANLAGGTAVIKVGGSTREEVIKRKHQVETAYIAAHAAIEEGFVAGGTATLVTAIPALDKVLTDSSEERIGVTILRHALEEPIRRITRDAGHRGSDIVTEVLKHGYPYGFDAKTGRCIDTFKAGIIEPAKLVRLTVQEAVNIAQKFLTTNI